MLLYVVIETCEFHKEWGRIMQKKVVRPILWVGLYSVRGLERSELGGSLGYPGRLWD